LGNLLAVGLALPAVAAAKPCPSRVEGVSKLSTFGVPAHLRDVSRGPGSRCDLANLIAEDATQDVGRDGRHVLIGQTYWRFRYNVWRSNEAASPTEYEGRVVARHGHWKVTLDLTQEYSNEDEPWEHS
jgi:hypothetical protein